MSSSLSKHRAGPLNFSPSLPVILATEPPGAREPFKIRMWPLSLIGFSSGAIIVCPSLSPGKSATFSASVLPVTVMQEPSINPFSSKYFITAGVPPIECRSS